MALSGDFVTPRLNGLKYFEKPPLQYWATAISFKLFGVSDLAARLYVALCGLGSALLVAFAATRLYDTKTGMLAAFILLASPYFAAISQIITLDIGLTFWLTLMLCAFLLSQAATDARDNRHWLWLAWAAAAGATLSKGLIGVVFPAATVFLYCLVRADFGLLSRLQWRWGPLVFFALVTPWFVLVQMQNPEFAQFFFIHERFTTDTHRRVGSWWYFVPILFTGLLAWLLAFFPAAWHGLKERGMVIRTRAHQKPFKPLLFLLIFCGFVFAFFSYSGSKLPGYIAPLFPPLAVVLAVYVRNASGRRLAWLVLPTALIGAAAAVWLWMAPLMILRCPPMAPRRASRRWHSRWPRSLRLYCCTVNAKCRPRSYSR
jgi:4-amino-4-deoxy-L-arabinose transferase-like glycosyltransferase